MLTIDGSTGEGGGQIARTALALSMITGQPFRINNIRQGRKDAGLKMQHLFCVKALQELSSAKADGVFKGSNEFLFIPGKLKAKNIEIDIETAGGITLLLQAVLLPSLFSTKPHTLTLCGGTDTQWSMPIDYFTNVLVPQYQRFGGIEVRLIKRGYYPKGRGKIEIKIKPEVKRNKYGDFSEFSKALSERAFQMNEQGKLLMIKGVSHASSDLEVRSVAERQARSAKQYLGRLGVPVEISQEYSSTSSTGSGITLWGIFSEREDEIAQPIRIGADALGEKRLSAEKVGINAAEDFISSVQKKAPVDKYLADNLIPLMALARPSSITVSEVTSHTKTNIWTAEQFLGKIFKIEKEKISSTWQV